jgi:hypothetical protein
MRHLTLSPAVAACVVLFAGAPAAAQYAYPAKGQSAATQAKDEAECSKWATGKTGFDPARPPPVAVAQPAPVTGSGARLRGAAAGAAISGISGGDAGEGALAGAAIGGVRRRAANRRAAEAQNQANAQQAQGVNAAYAQARGACLSGRGYSVK